MFSIDKLRMRLLHWMRCRHKNTSRAFSHTVLSTTPHREYYVKCLDCGEELDYDWEKMKICQ